MDDPELRLNIGIHTKEPSQLTQRYIEAFNTTEYNLIIYETEQECINSIGAGTAVLCAIFSDDFELRDGAKNELTFHVDESRMNLVDRLISSFSTRLGTETTEISEQLTEQLLQVIENTNKEAEESLAQIIIARTQTTTIDRETGRAKTTIQGMDTTKETINTGTLSSRINNLETDYVDIRTRAITVINRVNELNLSDDITAEKDVKTAIDNLNKTIQDADGITTIEQINTALTNLETNINKLTERIEKAGDVKTQTIQSINDAQTAIQTLLGNIDEVKTKQEQIIQDIETLEIRTARSITSLVNTQIESVSETNNRLTYSFSYLLTLAILFVGLMLSSTLVYMEKDSKAFFRNFTTPTTQKYFMFINYLTALIIILIQTILILAIAHYYLAVPILDNALVTSVILFIGITLFIILGLFIGTISTTSEAVTMSNIVIGSVFLFLSNLILPLETLSPLIAKIASFNPYVIVSEGIRKAMLFNAGFEQIIPDIMMLLAYIAILVTFMIIINQLGFKHFLATRRHKKNLLVTEPEHLILEINNDVKIIKNIPDLIKTLKDIKEKEYEEITKKDNPIREWLRHTLNKRMLAIRLKNKKLEVAIEVLEKYQNKIDHKEQKNNEKEQKKQIKKERKQRRKKQKTTDSEKEIKIENQEQNTQQEQPKPQETQQKQEQTEKENNKENQDK